MQSELGSLSTFFKKLGQCQRCIQKSFLASVAAWAVYALTASAALPHAAQIPIAVIATGLTALWLAHLTAFVLRSCWFSRDRQIDVAERRQALSLMARAAGVAVLSSVPAVLLPESAAAFCGQCTKNADCGYGWSCKNTAPVNSGKVCNECVED
jgi:hypothetical protein